MGDIADTSPDNQSCRLQRIADFSRLKKLLLWTLILVNSIPLPLCYISIFVVYKSVFVIGRWIKTLLLWFSNQQLAKTHPTMLNLTRCRVKVIEHFYFLVPQLAEHHQNMLFTSHVVGRYPHELRWLWSKQSSADNPRFLIFKMPNQFPLVPFWHWPVPKIQVLWWWTLQTPTLFPIKWLWWFCLLVNCYSYRQVQ